MSRVRSAPLWKGEVGGSGSIATLVPAGFRWIIKGIIATGRSDITVPTPSLLLSATDFGTAYVEIAYTAPGPSAHDTAFSREGFWMALNPGDQLEWVAGVGGDGNIGFWVSGAQLELP